MKIKNLNDLKIFVNRSVLISFCVVFTIAAAMFLAAHITLEGKKEQFGKQQVQAASNLYQSMMSEKLSIIASSSVFLDYLRSGNETQKDLYPEFLVQILSLKIPSIIGMEITESANYSTDVPRNIFTYGTKSPQKIILKLCYLNQNLDNEMGACQYSWALYFSKSEIVKTLTNINQSIGICADCQPTDLISNSKFGSFLIADHNPIMLKIKSVDKQSDAFLLYALFMVVILASFAVWNRFRTKKIIGLYIANPIDEITDKLKTNNPLEEKPGYLNELKYLIAQIKHWREKEREAKIGQIAAQVAHDIRSPLAALDMAVKIIETLPEAQRAIITGATNRIHDIANNLLNQYQRRFSDDSSTQAPELVSSLLDSIISEKRAQYSEKQIDFQLIVDENAYGTFANINAIELKRVISNVVNNSVESITGQGKVTISLNNSANKTLQITILDNGGGIPKEVLTKILVNHKVESSKKGGAGLGLSHATSNIKSWGGEYDIQSEVGVGTKFIITIPSSPHPDWFIHKLILWDNAKVAVLDDDEAIHNVWNQRLENFVTKNNVSIAHFYSPMSLVNAQKNENFTADIYLVDHELLGTEMNGIDVIKSLNLADKAILVTSRYEDSKIRSECENIGVKIIPKVFAVHIPIELKK